MIKINLALKKSAAMVASAAEPLDEDSGSKLSLGTLREIKLDDLKDLPNLRALGVFLAAACMSIYFLSDYNDTELARLEAQVTQARNKQSELRKSLDASKKLAEMKKSLESDEIVIRTKLDTIQKLLQERGTSSNILLAISQSIPKQVWLGDLKVQETDVGVKGDALDFNQISEFMRSLNESAYFKDVALKSSAQSKDDTGAEVAKFELVAKRR